MKYTLFYAGYNRKKDEEQVGIAFSSDLKNWSFGGDGPIIPLGFSGSGDAIQTSNPCVIKVGNTYKMWYQGRGENKTLGVFHTQSSDCVQWEKAVQVLTYRSEQKIGERFGFQHPHVIYKEGKYMMWFVFSDSNKSNIGFCVSNDGVEWSDFKYNIISPEFSWEERGLYYPMVLLENGIYKLWYTGRSIAGQWSIGYAESNDGLNWQKNMTPIISKINFPKILKRGLEFILKILKREINIPLYGIASVNVWKENEVYYLIAHEVGTHGKLYIPQYSSLDGVLWKKIHNNLFEETHFDEWNNFFQADPYLYVE